MNTPSICRPEDQPLVELLHHRYWSAADQSIIEPITQQAQVDVDFIKQHHALEDLDLYYPGGLVCLGFYQGDPQVFIVTADAVRLYDSGLTLMHDNSIIGGVGTSLMRVTMYNAAYFDPLNCISHVYETKSSNFIGATTMSVSFPYP